MLSAMKRAMLVVGVCVGLAACQNNGGGDDYPIGGGGNNGASSGGGHGSDGGIDAATGDAGTPIAGRVCLLSDLRQIGATASCSTTKAGGLIVTLGNRTATTAVDGKFTINAPAGSSLTWRVTGDGKAAGTVQLQPSVMPLGLDPTIPAIAAGDYTNLLSQNEMVTADQQGAVIVRVLKNGAPAVGATATSSPQAQRLALYDSSSAVTWSDAVTGTSTKGIVWFANLPLNATPPTTAAISVKETSSSTPVLTSGLVENQSITFLTVELQ